MKDDMYQIPYVEHEYRMFKAYKREMKLKSLLICTNVLWLVVLLFLLVR